MDLDSLHKHKKRKLEHISDFHEAAQNFEELQNSTKEIQTATRTTSTSSHILDEIINKLCRGDEDFEVSHDSCLFYDIVYHADYLHIKTELEEKFYSGLSEKFILTGLIHEINKNLELLRPISHVKKLLLQGCFKVLHMIPMMTANGLSLEYFDGNTWKDIDIEMIQYVEIKPSAFEFLSARNGFSFTHLNFIFKLLDVIGVSLYACSLDGGNSLDLFDGLKLEFLNLSACGNNINQIIQKNIPGPLQYLTHLNASHNVLLKETVSKISQLPLKTLTVSRCFCDEFMKISNIVDTDIDDLLRSDTIRGTIEDLDISLNKLTMQNLDTIVGLNLKYLNVVGSLKGISIANVEFPSSLNTLMARENKFFIEDLLNVAGLPLEKLDLDCYTNENDDLIDRMDKFLNFNKSFKQITIRFHVESELNPFVTTFTIDSHNGVLVPRPVQLYQTVGTSTSTD